MNVSSTTSFYLGTNPYQNVKKTQKNSKINSSANPTFNGYKEVFQDAFCQKFTKKFEVEQTYRKLVDAAMSECKSFPESLRRLPNSNYSFAVELGNYIKSHIDLQLPDEKAYCNGKVVALGGTIGVHFYDPENSRRWISFRSDSKTIELNVLQMHEYGYNDYTFWHSDSGNLKKHIYNSGNYSETTRYNLDGSEQDIIDRFKNFFGF